MTASTPLQSYAPVRTTIAMVQRIATRGVDPIFTGTSASGETMTLSGADFADQVARVAGILVERGICPGESVCILMDNTAGLEANVLHLGIHWAGAVAVPVNTRLSDPEIETIVAHADCRLLASAGLPAQRARSMSERLAVPLWDMTSGLSQCLVDSRPLRAADSSEHDLADILYTSGTTGTPKGVELTHANCVACGLELQEAMRLGADDVLMSAVPYFTSTGAHTNPLAAFVTPCHYVLEPDFDQHAYLERLSKYGVTVYFGVPSMFQLIMRDAGVPAGLPRHLVRLVFGGSVTTAESLARMAEAFPGRDLVNLYGLTEGGPGGSCIGPEDILLVPGSVGCRGNGRHTIVAVLREDGSIADPDEVGEICVRSPAVMRGYRNNPEATAFTLRGDWLHTSDYGYKDGQGYLWYVGRRDDLITRGGFNIATGEVEAVLATFPGVVECSVVGVPHDILGQDLVAYVVMDGQELDVIELADFMGTRIADYKIPRRVLVIDALPRSAMGKVLKRSLPPPDDAVLRLSIG